MKIPKKTVDAFPELALFEDENDRKQAFKTACRGIYANWRLWALVPVLGLFVKLMLMGLDRTLVGLFDVSLVGGSGLAGGVVGGTLGSIALWLSRKRVRQSLRWQLNQRGIPVCLRCGYSLQGNLSGVCSECGSPRTDKCAEQ